MDGAAEVGSNEDAASNNSIRCGNPNCPRCGVPRGGLEINDEKDYFDGSKVTKPV